MRSSVKISSHSSANPSPGSRTGSGLKLVHGAESKRDAAPAEQASHIRLVKETSNNASGIDLPSVSDSGTAVPDATASVAISRLTIENREDGDRDGALTFSAAADAPSSNDEPPTTASTGENDGAAVSPTTINENPHSNPPATDPEEEAIVTLKPKSSQLGVQEVLEGEPTRVIRATVTADFLDKTKDVSKKKVVLEDVTVRDHLGLKLPELRSLLRGSSERAAWNPFAGGGGAKLANPFGGSGVGSGVGSGAGSGAGNPFAAATYGQHHSPQADSHEEDESGDEIETEKGYARRLELVRQEALKASILFEETLGRDKLEEEHNEMISQIEQAFARREEKLLARQSQHKLVDSGDIFGLEDEDEDEDVRDVMSLVDAVRYETDSEQPYDDDEILSEYARLFETVLFDDGSPSSRIISGIERLQAQLKCALSRRENNITCVHRIIIL